MARSLTSLINCRRALAAGVIALPVAFAFATPTLSQGFTQEIVITISHVKAITKEDLLSKADFLARVTIDGQASVTDVVRNQDEIRPNWVIRKRVRPGLHNVKLEILDKDVTKNDFIDVNRVDGKRDLDFQVNTNNCGVFGFSQYYSCRQPIERQGAERKSASVTFSVDVTR